MSGRPHLELEARLAIALGWRLYRDGKGAQLLLRAGEGEPPALVPLQADDLRPSLLRRSSVPRFATDPHRVQQEMAAGAWLLEVSATGRTFAARVWRGSVEAAEEGEDYGATIARAFLQALGRSAGQGSTPTP